MPLHLGVEPSEGRGNAAGDEVAETPVEMLGDRGVGIADVDVEPVDPVALDHHTVVRGAHVDPHVRGDGLHRSRGRLDEDRGAAVGVAQMDADVELVRDGPGDLIDGDFDDLATNPLDGRVERCEVVIGHPAIVADPTRRSVSGVPASSPTQRPSALLFDVNETLSDLSPMGDCFAEVGLPPHLAATWFAGLLRDGFAVTVTGRQASFREIGADVLRGLAANTDGIDVDAAIERVFAAFMTLDLHPDVVEGLRALGSTGVRMATLTNGAAAVPESLLARAGVDDVMERFLSVDDAGIWKPHPDAYGYAVRAMDVEASAAMLVASHPWDIDGAARAGLATAFVNRAGRPYPRHFERADVEVESLPELAAHLS